MNSSSNYTQSSTLGTNDMPDWYTNLIFQPKYYDSFMWENKKITLKVHKSWASMYKVMKYFVRKEVMEFADPTVVCGFHCLRDQSNRVVADMLEKGVVYSNLKDSYIIAICPFDYYDKQLGGI